jgi:uncharacterized protein (TIGR02996 family)
VQDEEIFTREIRANPDDVSARLIYADFLEDHGIPLGDLIRCQVELGQLAIADPRRVALAEQERALLDEHGEIWLSEFRALGVSGVTSRCFHFGLIERVRIDSNALLKNGERLLRIAPGLRSLEISNAKAAIRSLARYPFPSQIDSIDLSRNSLTAVELQLLTGAVWTEQLRELDLSFNLLAGCMGDAFRLFTQSSFPMLEKLSMIGCKLPAEACEEIAGSNLLMTLKALNLSLNKMGDQGISLLIAERVWLELERLNLASCEIGVAGALAISPSQFPQLRQLVLRGNRLEIEGCRHLMLFAEMADVTELDLRNMELRFEDLAQLRQQLTTLEGNVLF